MTQEEAEKILKVRDAIIEQDYNEAWHWLYSIASPGFDKLEPWEELENLASKLTTEDIININQP